MEIYLVGGAVRDELLGRPVHERDWVVVGGSVQQLLDAGYRQVGKDFPVFLHPETSEEYALARTERKTGPGHTGFEVHADAAVTLEEDLSRRDLTINAMARDSSGRIIDPFQGQKDLEDRLLVHVSAAFAEDPLRVFRVARFAAQLPGFSVAGNTAALMAEMARAGDLAELSAERVWAELVKALNAPDPGRFFAVLRESGAMRPWFRELEASLEALLEALKVPDLAVVGSTDQRFALLSSVLELDAAATLGRRLKVPRACSQLAAWIIEWGEAIAAWRTTPTETVFHALSVARAFKPDSNIAHRLRVVEVIAEVDLTELLAALESISRTVTAAIYQRKGLDGAALGQALDLGRIKAIHAAQEQ